MLKQLAKSNSHRKGVTQKLFLAGIVTLLCLIGAGVGNTFSGESASATTTGSSRVAVSLSDIIALHVMDSSATSEINNLNIDITPTPNGVFNKNSMMVEVSTSNVTGYKLYMTSIGTSPVGDTSENYTTDLVNLDSTVTDSIPTLASGASITEADFRVNNSNYKNKWGYSLNSYTVTQTEDSSGIVNNITEITDTSAITYTNVPMHGTNIEIGSNNTAATKKLTPVTIGVNASSAIPAGTYQNTLEYTAIANPIPKDFTLYFDKNTEDAVTDFPETMTVSSVASSYTFTIPDTVPSRDGYELSEYNTAADGSGDSYQPGDEFTITADDSNPDSMAKTLYAIWEEAGPKDFWHITYMQEMTADICAAETTPKAGSSISSPSTTLPDTDGSHHGDTNYVPERQLFDWRGADGTGDQNNKAPAEDGATNAISYTVRKLADGNCWMTENLKLPLSTSQAVEVVNNSDGSLKGSKWTPTGSGGTGNAATPMNGNTFYNSTYDSWYYSWYAAIATDNPSAASSAVNTDQTYSICPKGWRLPANYAYSSAANKKSFGSLTNAYLGITASTSTSTGYKTMEAFPLNFPRAGYTDSGSYYDTGNGYYWSSTAYSSATLAYSLYFATTVVAPQGNDYKYFGFNVRCVAV